MNIHSVVSGAFTALGFGLTAFFALIKVWADVPLDWLFVFLPMIALLAVGLFFAAIILICDCIAAVWNFIFGSDDYYVP